MLCVAEHYAVTDTGRQRRGNEDSMLARSPLFVVADGMGGAQAGEVASRLAVEAFGEPGEGFADPQAALIAYAERANARIYELAHSDAAHAGMGTTVTAVHVGEREVTVAHVGDSRAYCMRDGELMRLTDDHSLVDELIRQGRLTPEEAEEHPQRSIITRALGPEASVEVDARSFAAKAGDRYMLCSDGLTSMVSERALADILAAHDELPDAGDALIDAANAAGGRDNITVVLIRLEEVQGGERVDAPTAQTEAIAPLRRRDRKAARAQQRASEEPPAAAQGGLEGPAGQDRAAGRLAEQHLAAQRSATASARKRRLPRSPTSGRHPRKRSKARKAAAPLTALVLLCILLAAAWLAVQSVFFIATNDNGLVAIYKGIPYVLPGKVELYSVQYVSGVSASTLTPRRRDTLLDHSLRSEKSAGELVRELERGRLSGG